MSTYYYTTTEEYWVDASPGERVDDKRSIRWVEYDGSSDSTRNEHIEMKPYDDHWYGDSINMSGYKKFW